MPIAENDDQFLNHPVHQLHFPTGILGKQIPALFPYRSSTHAWSLLSGKDSWMVALQWNGFYPVYKTLKLVNFYWLPKDFVLYRWKAEQTGYHSSLEIHSAWEAEKLLLPGEENPELGHVSPLERKQCSKSSKALQAASLVSHIPNCWRIASVRLIQMFYPDSQGKGSWLNVSTGTDGLSPIVLLGFELPHCDTAHVSEGIIFRSLAGEPAWKTPRMRLWESLLVN